MSENNNLKDKIKEFLNIKRKEIDKFLKSVNEIT